MDAYVNANTCNNYLDEETDVTEQSDLNQGANRNTDESNSLSFSVDKSNLEQQNQQAQTSTQAAQSQKSAKSQANEVENGEEWLHHYMLGKIKEKLNHPIMETLNHYLKSITYLQKNNATYLKRLTYKTKGNFSVESNEVYYRIYALVLKRIDRLEIRSNVEELKSISSFLESIMDTKFVKIHNDFQLEEISLFLIELFKANSKQIYEVEHDDLFVKSVCICIAGLNQILKRFSQHYRSMYRLAHFYSRFLDFQV